MSIDHEAYRPEDLSFAASDPAFEKPGVTHLTVVSPALQSRADLTVFVPSQAKGRANAPVIVLLHGVYASHWAWLGLAGADQTLMRLIESERLTPFILAMPSDGLWGEGSGYLRHDDFDSEGWIADEVPTVLTMAIDEITDRSRFYIAGMSMGGFGALRIGAKRSDRFHAFAGHSSVTHARQLAGVIRRSAIFESWPEPDASVLETIRRNCPGCGPFRFDCGVEDEFIEANRELHAGLKAARISHRYEEFPGGHDWSYWADHLAETLRFFDSREREGERDSE